MLGKDVTEEKNRITGELFKKEHSSNTRRDDFGVKRRFKNFPLQVYVLDKAIKNDPCNLVHSSRHGKPIPSVVSLFCLT